MEKLDSLSYPIEQFLRAGIDELFHCLIPRFGHTKTFPSMSICSLCSVAYRKELVERILTWVINPVPTSVHDPMHGAKNDASPPDMPDGKIRPLTNQSSYSISILTSVS